MLEKKKKLRRKHLKQKGRNMRVEAEAKSERANRELKGKLLPISTFFFFFMIFFSLFFFPLLIKNKKMLGKSV